MRRSSRYLAASVALTAISLTTAFTLNPLSRDLNTQRNSGNAFTTSSPTFIGSTNTFQGRGPLYEYLVASSENTTDTPISENCMEDQEYFIHSPDMPKKLVSGGGNNNAQITLVGSGPGDPDLLTVAAYRIITDPSVFIVADRLVSPEILALIQGEYKIARKLPGCAEKAQREIYDWCEEALQQGKHVIRLKIGDPFVFGRGGEEVIRFRSMGYEPNVIPGVSAAFAAPLLGSIPVTHRGVSNQVVMCTGYGRNGTSPDLIRYHPEQTVVFLMAVGRLHELCQNLINMAGYPSKTPVAIVEKAGCPEQRTLVGNMENIGDLAAEYEIKPPSTIVVGEVVNVLLAEEGEEAAHGLVSNNCKELNKAIEGN